MQYSPKTTSTDSIFERTHAGQCEMLTNQVQLDAFERRLLAVMTGFTALGDIMRLLGETDLPHAALSKLLEEGLIKLTQKKHAKVDMAAHRSAWRAAHPGAGA